MKGNTQESADSETSTFVKDSSHSVHQKNSTMPTEPSKNEMRASVPVLGPVPTEESELPMQDARDDEEDDEGEDDATPIGDPINGYGEDYGIDYDEGATYLYKRIEVKDWDAAISRVILNAHEAAQWVYRLESPNAANKSGKRKVRWRLLPLHSAVIFGSPTKLITKLIEAFPESPKKRDDQLMLPIHLACRHDASKDSIVALVEAFPESLHEGDRKGRTPLVLLEEAQRLSSKRAIPESSSQRKEREQIIAYVKRILSTLPEPKEDQATMAGRDDMNDAADSIVSDTRSFVPKKDVIKKETIDVKKEVVRESSRQEPSTHSASPRKSRSASGTAGEISCTASMVTPKMNNAVLQDDAPAPPMPVLSGIEQFERSSVLVKNLPVSPTSPTSQPPVFEANPVVADFEEFEPSAQLKELLDIISEEIEKAKTVGGSESPTKGGVNPARSVNACGSLKIVTMNKTKQGKLARTKRVLSTLSQVVSSPHGTLESRQRSIGALLHLANAKENWEIMLSSMDIRSALYKALPDDDSRIRREGALCLSLLAKSDINKKLIVEDPKLVEAISQAIEIESSAKQNKKPPRGKKKPSQENQEESMHTARLVLLQMLFQISKVQGATYEIVRATDLMGTLLKFAGAMEKGENNICIAVLANLTRLPSNARCLVFKTDKFVSTLVDAVQTQNGGPYQRGGLYGIQNLSCSRSCRANLAATPKLLTSVTRAGFNSKSEMENQVSALHILRNLSDEPANLISITDTPGCTAALLALANDKSSGMLQYLACDALATLSYWLQTSSESRVPRGLASASLEKLPTMRLSTWNQWE